MLPDELCRPRHTKPELVWTFSLCPTGPLKETSVCPPSGRQRQGRGRAAHSWIPKGKEQSPLDSMANSHSLNEPSLLNSYESASWKCDFLLMYVYSTNSVTADYCYRRHAEQSKKWEEKWQKFHLTESSTCLLQNFFLIHHSEFWPSSRWPSTATISLFACPFEVELHYLANTAEPANPSREIPEAKLMFPLLRCSYQRIRPSWDYTHPANRSYSPRGCHNRLFMQALHNFATARV